MDRLKTKRPLNGPALGLVVVFHSLGLMYGWAAGCRVHAVSC
jgi:hypothetical protein